ncbi:unnamed protein product [Urochloa humidicola]
MSVKDTIQAPDLASIFFLPLSTEALEGTYNASSTAVDMHSIFPENPLPDRMSLGVVALFVYESSSCSETGAMTQSPLYDAMQRDGSSSDPLRARCEARPCPAPFAARPQERRRGLATRGRSPTRAAGGEGSSAGVRSQGPPGKKARTDGIGPTGSAEGGARRRDSGRELVGVGHGGKGAHEVFSGLWIGTTETHG